MSIGDRLKRIRELRGLSKSKLARDANHYTTAITKIEAGAIAEPRITTLKRLAKALHVPLEFLTDESIELSTEALEAMPEKQDNAIDLKQLGLAIKNRRLAARLSQSELAKKAKISEVYMGYIERGVANPSSVILHSVAKALNVDLEDLMAHLQNEERL